MIMTCKSQFEFLSTLLDFSLFCTFIKLGTLAHCQLYHLVSEVGPSQSDFPHVHLEKSGFITRQWRLRGLRQENSSQ